MRNERKLTKEEKAKYTIQITMLIAVTTCNV